MIQDLKNSLIPANVQESEKTVSNFDREVDPRQEEPGEGDQTNEIERKPKTTQEKQDARDQWPTIFSLFFFLLQVVSIFLYATQNHSTSVENPGFFALNIICRDSSVQDQTEFNRTRSEYEAGFGDLYNSFVGLNSFHTFMDETCATRKPRLVIEMIHDGKYYEVTYSELELSGSDDDFRLTVGGFWSSDPTVKDELSKHSGMKFTTRDVDNDLSEEGNCSYAYGFGGFWFHDCWSVVFTGQAVDPKPFKGLHWYSLTGPYQSLQHVRMRAECE